MCQSLRMFFISQIQMHSMQRCKVLADIPVKTKNGSSPDVGSWDPSVSTLWRSVRVRDGQGLSIGISRALAKTASVAGGLKSRGNNSGPSWVSLGQDWSIQGISIALAKALWGPVAVGSTSWVKAGTSQSAVGCIGIEGVGGSQAQKR